MASLDKFSQSAILSIELPRKEPFKVLSLLGAFYNYQRITYKSLLLYGMSDVISSTLFVLIFILQFLL